VDLIRTGLGELPAALRSRLSSDFNISEYDADVLVNQGRQVVDYYLQVAKASGDGKAAANWVTQDALRLMKERDLAIENMPVKASALADLIKRFNIPLDEYITRCERQLAGWEKLRAKMEQSDAALQVQRSPEYGSLIIHSIETGQPRVVYGNLPNHHLIDNLPQGCCVEVPVLVDKSGLQPTRIGALPPQLAALMQTNVNVQSLTVEAALTRKREHIYHAAMLDPHTAAELDLDQIHALVDDLIAAHGDWLPAYQ